MTTEQLITLVSSICGILTFGGIIIAKLLKSHVAEIVNGLIKNYLSELKPNHGSSLRDDVVAIKNDITSIKVDLANLEGKFDQHITETLN